MRDPMGGVSRERPKCRGWRRRRFKIDIADGIAGDELKGLRRVFEFAGR